MKFILPFLFCVACLAGVPPLPPVKAPVPASPRAALVYPQDATNYARAHANVLAVPNRSTVVSVTCDCLIGLVADEELMVQTSGCPSGPWGNWQAVDMTDTNLWQVVNHQTFTHCVLAMTNAANLLFFRGVHGQKGISL